MARAYGATSFEEEKQLIIKKAQELRPLLDWEKIWEASEEVERLLEEFQTEFGNASQEAREDRDVVLAAVSTDGGLLKSLNEAYRDNNEVALAAVLCRPVALEFLSERLLNDRDFMMTVMSSKGTALFYAPSDYRRDRAMVMAAVKSDGGALESANEAMRADKELITVAVSQNALALRCINPNLTADKDIILAAFSAAGPPRLTDFVWQTISSGAREDKDVVLAATRSGFLEKRKRGDFFYKDAPKVQAAIAWKDFEAAALSALALPGDAAPVLQVAISKVRSSGEPFAFRCEASWLSGRSFTCSVIDDYNDNTPTVSDLTVRILEELKDCAEACDPQRLFINVVHSDGTFFELTPWDCNRRLAEFV